MKSTNYTYNIYYDEEADFLEIAFGEPLECYADEIEPGVFIRKDEKTKEIKSIGILGFKKRAQILREILNKTNLKFPINIAI